MAGVRNGALVQTRLMGVSRQTVGVVPSGATWLLKDVVVTAVSDPGGHVLLAAQSVTLGIEVVFAALTLDTTGARSWSGWMAFNQGDRLRVESSAGATDIWASGAELPGTVNFVV